MAKPVDRREKLAREMTHRNFATADDRLTAFDELVNAPSRADINKAIDVGMGRMGRDVAYGEKPLAGGLDIAEVGGIPINATDFIGTGIPSKLALGAKAFAPALAAALGGTAIASKASQGAKLNALANVLNKERGIFAGVNAKTADLVALERAKQMQSAGVPDAEIWPQTGWALDTPDKMPRFEIPDNAASMMQDAPSQLSKYPGRRQSHIFAHDDLYGAYPESADIWTGKIPGEYGGSYAGGVMGKSDMVNIGIPKKNIDMNELAGTNLHELQHAIQQREGFARGGSADAIARNPAQYISQSDIEYAQSLPAYARAADKDEFLRDYAGMRLDDPRLAYQRLAGEAEARLTQARMNMTPEQRLAQYPYAPEYFRDATGVNLEDLIVRKDGGVAMSVPAKTEFELAHEVAQRNAALPVEQGGLGLPPNNTAMDRAKAMGFDTPAYHGRNGELYRPKEISDQARALRAEGSKIEDMFREKYGRDADGFYRTGLYKTDPLYAKQKALFDQATKTEGDYWIGDADISNGGFDVSKTGDIGTHLALDPMVSSKFAEHGAVMPLLTKSGNLRRVEDVFSIHLGAGRAVDELYRVGLLPEKSYDKFAGIAKKLDSQTHLDQRDWGEQKGLIDFWKKLNTQVTKNPKTNLIYNNEIEGGGDSLSILNPSSIRSRFAAFDPKKRNSANILAGGAAGAVGLNALAPYLQESGD